MTMWTFSEKLKGFSQIVKEQSGIKIIEMCYTHPITIIYKYENLPSKEKLCVCIVNDFAMEYLREYKKVRETVFFCSYGAQVEYFKPPPKKKNCQKYRVTVP